MLYTTDITFKMIFEYLDHRHQNSIIHTIMMITVQITLIILIIFDYWMNDLHLIMTAHTSACSRRLSDAQIMMLCSPIISP